MDWLTLWGWIAGGLFLAFSLCFLLARAIKNFGVVDVLWGFGFALVTLFAADLSMDEGWLPRRLIVLGLVVLASARLGGHLLKRFIKWYPEEDRRYASMREHWTKHPYLAFYGAYLLQAGLMVLLSLPILWALLASPQTFLWTDIAGGVVLAIAVVGESVADNQLAQFIDEHKDDPKAICNVGLWRYSRHPNYFFQWSQWVGIALLGMAHPLGWFGWLAPLLMFHFLMNVTGIKISEEQAIKKRGEAYREYQRETSAFFPWFPKTA